MTTLNDLIVQVRQQLLGYAKQQLSVSELAAPIGASDTTFTADGATVTNLSRGLVEIDDELILVKSFDRNSGVVTVMGATNGRGYEGTVAAAHAQHALIVADPPFPRARVKEAINDTIAAMFPDLVIFANTEIVKLQPVFEYELPAEATDVWYITGQLVGPSKVWQPLQNWRFNPMANTADFPSGKSVEIFDFVTAGRAQRVTYVKAPTLLSAGTDPFSATGYPDRFADIVKWGACARLLPAYEAARLQQKTVESTERAPLVPPKAATQAAAYFQQLYYQRLQEERRRQWEEVPSFQRFQS